MKGEIPLHAFVTNCIEFRINASDMWDKETLNMMMKGHYKLFYHSQRKEFYLKFYKNKV